MLATSTLRDSDGEEVRAGELLVASSATGGYCIIGVSSTCGGRERAVFIREIEVEARCFPLSIVVDERAGLR